MSDREFTTPLYMLRCIEVGLSVADLNELTVGFVMDMFTEKSFDETGHIRKARQSDIDKL